MSLGFVIIVNIENNIILYKKHNQKLKDILRKKKHKNNELLNDYFILAKNN